MKNNINGKKFREITCPHCNGKIELDVFDRRILLEAAKNETHTMASLVKLTGQSRGNISHHINVLEQQGKIYFEQLKFLPGKPKIIRIVQTEGEK